MDVGTGYGHFLRWLLREGHHPIGVSANDYRDFDFGLPRIPDTNYIVGDAHGLVNLLEPNSQFDLATTRWTLRHLVDPLSVLEQMANAVRTNGLLVFDSFRWNPDVHRNVGFGIVAIALQEAGFDLIDGAGTPRAIDQDRYASTFDSVWRRGDDSQPVRFPIDYDTYGLDTEVATSFRYVLREQ